MHTKAARSYHTAKQISLFARQSTPLKGRRFYSVLAILLAAWITSSVLTLSPNSLSLCSRSIPCQSKHSKCFGALQVKKTNCYFVYHTVFTCPSHPKTKTPPRTKPSPRTLPVKPFRKALRPFIHTPTRRKPRRPIFRSRGP